MRGFMAIVRIEFAVLLANRGVAVLGAIHHLLLVGSQILLWSSIMGTRVIATESGPITRLDMISYILLATTLSTLADFKIVDTVNEQARSGQVAVDVLRPVGFPAMILARELARFSFGIATQALPVLVAYGFLFGLAVPKIGLVLSTILLVLGGWTLATAFGWCVGVLALRLLETTHVKYALQGLSALLSGALVPLWFFPDALLIIAEWLPFHLLFYAPLSVWLGRAGPEVIAGYFWSLAFWISASGILAYTAWRWSRANMSVQGG